MLLAALGVLLIWSFLPASPRKDGFVDVAIADTRPGAVAAQLHAEGLVDSPSWMTWYMRLLAPGVSFKARGHLLRTGMTPRQLVQSLGEVGRTDFSKLLIPEGFNRYQVAQRLEERGICSELAFLDATTNPGLLTSLHLSGPSLEGYLFPATYEFPLDEDPLRVARRLHAEAARRFLAVSEKSSPRAPEIAQLGFSAEDVVTLASIVEKESSKDSERPRIARVFYNRLLSPAGETRGRLESDPTAAYACLGPAVDKPPGCAGGGLRPTPAMLRDADNPYNTYRNAGLPPGPIGNPGEASLAAVLSPADGRFFYFVADGTGGHAFSETFAEHREAVKRLRAIRGRSLGKEAKNPD